MATTRWRWSYPPGGPSRSSLESSGQARSVLWQWEYGWMGPGRRALLATWRVLRRPLPGVLVAVAAFGVGVLLASGPDSATTNWQLRHQLGTAQRELRARQGELELVRLELSRVNAVMDNSAHYRIPADLAAQIYDIALSEGIDPDIAFRLVSVESEFTGRAVSPKGAIGLTQVMPSTARLLNPRLSRDDLFHHETNLRLGFSYLRDLIQEYDGDLRLALLAYNRGPAVVDALRKQGRDPENGYARAILRPSLEGSRAAGVP
jgi:soluble lytic murein transglycosylase-like protein